MRLGLLLSALLICFPASAGVNDPTWNPPVRFDYPYPGKLTVIYLPQKQVVTACAELFAKYKVDAKPFPDERGCSAITSATSCTIIAVDKTFKRATPKAVVRHEMGHCNGWPANHPD
jgi:hypothetical protein